MMNEYRRMPRLLTLLAAPFFALPAHAADGFDLSGTMRLRYEAIANQPRAGFRRDDDLVSLRTTLLGRYTDGPLTLAAELWDSRVYADKARSPITTGEVNTLEFVQAYAAYSAPLPGGGKATLQAGRFLLNIGSRRLVAADDYRNTTNGYTGLHAELAGGGATASLIYVLPQQRRPDVLPALRRNKVALDHEGFDAVLWGGTVAKAKALGPVTAEATYYHFGERDLPGRPTRNRSLDTYGGRLIRDPKPSTWDGEVEAFRQTGHIDASTAPGAARLPVLAWFVHADLGYTFPGAWKAHLSVEYDRATGDAPGGHYTRFDTLFGMRRADFAPAGLYNAIARTNLSTPGVRLEATPSKRWDALATYHALWLAERTDAFSASGVRDPSGRSGTFAGHQLDGRIRYWLRPDTLRFEADGVVLTRGRFLETAPNRTARGTTFYGAVSVQAMF